MAESCAGLLVGRRMEVEGVAEIRGLNALQVAANRDGAATPQVEPAMGAKALLWRVSGVLSNSPW